MEHCCQLEGAYVSESSCLDNVWPPWEDPTMPAEDLGRSILAFLPICARVTVLSRQRPASRPARHPPTEAGCSERGLGGTHGPRMWHHTWLVNLLSSPTRHLMPSIVSSGASAITALPFHRATFPTIEMLSAVMRSRLEGEGSVGHEPGLPWSKEDAHSSCVSNVMTSRGGDLGGLGLTQLTFNNVSRTHQLRLPRGRLGVIMFEHSRQFNDVPQWFMSLPAA